MRLFLLGVICGVHGFVQGSVCREGNFRLNPDKDHELSGCFIDVCEGGEFRPYGCKSLMDDARCDEEDLKNDDMRRACGCCGLPPPMIQAQPIRIQDMHP